MALTFESSASALTQFKQHLRDRGITVVEEEVIPTSAGRGKTVYQKQLWTNSREVFHVKHWSNKWIPKDSGNVSEFAKPLDERLKFAIRTFGNGDHSASGLNEGTLISLLEAEGGGYETFLVTTYNSGEVLWCKATELYHFASMHGLLPQFSRTYGEPFCWVPTGWLKPLNALKSAPPEVAL